MTYELPITGHPSLFARSVALLAALGRRFTASWPQPVRPAVNAALRITGNDHDEEPPRPVDEPEEYWAYLPLFVP